MVLGCVYIWYRILLTPYKVKIHDDDLVEFISILKTIKIYPKDIESIEEFDATASIKVHHARGETRISSLFDELGDLKRTLKSFCSKRARSERIEQNENMDKIDSINNF